MRVEGPGTLGLWFDLIIFETKPSTTAGRRHFFFYFYFYYFPFATRSLVSDVFLRAYPNKCLK